MNTEELYRDLMFLFFEHSDRVPWKEICMGFASELIKSNDIPDGCEFCIFEQFYDDTRCCRIIENYSHVAHITKPICTTTDFVKYLLREI